jgi:WD40 repeat protein
MMMRLLFAGLMASVLWGQPQMVLQGGGHTGPVRVIRYSTDGTWFVTGGDDGLLKVWETSPLREVRSLEIGARSVDISADGEWIAATSGQQPAFIRVKDFRVIAGVGEPTAGVAGVAMLADGRHAISVDAGNGHLREWDVATGKELRIVANLTTKGQLFGDEVSATVLRPDRRAMAVAAKHAGSELRYVVMVDLQSFLVSAPLIEEAKNEVRALAYSLDGAMLAIGSDSKVLRVFSTATGKELFRREMSEAMIAAAFSHDGKTLAGLAGETVVTCSTSLKCGDAVTMHTPVGAFWSGGALAFDRNDGVLVAGTNGCLSWFDAKKGVRTGVVMHRFGTYDAVFGPDGSSLAIAESGAMYRMWNLASGVPVERVRDDEPEPGVSADAGNHVFFLPSGELLVTTLKDRARTYRIQKVDSKRQVLDDVVSDSAMASPDGRWLVFENRKHAIELLDLKSGTAAVTLTQKKDGVKGLAFNADSTLIVFSGAEGIEAWDVAERSLKWTLEKNGDEFTGSVFAFDGAGHVAIAGSSARLVICDEKTGAIQGTPEAVGMPGFFVKAMKFSPDRQWLAIATQGSVLLWNAGAKKAIGLDNEGGNVNSVDFSKDGRWLATSGEQGSVRLWKWQEGKLALTLLSSEESTDWLAFTPEGLFDGSVRMWDRIVWRTGDGIHSVAPADALFRYYFRPGLVGSLFRGLAVEVAAKVPEHLSTATPRLDVAIAEAANAGDLPLEARRVHVLVRVADPENAGITDVRLFRNGKLVRIWRGGQKAGTYEAVTPIVAGRNEFSAYAFSTEQIRSAEARVAVEGASDLQRRGVAYVIAIGIDKYENPAYDLRYAKADANLVAESLKASLTALGEYQEVRVVRFEKGQETKAKILEALRALAWDAKPVPGAVLLPAEPDDAVVIYYAGHGTSDGRHFYMLPRDFGYRGKQIGAGGAGFAEAAVSAISDAELQQVLEKIDAGPMALVIDACNSGQLLASADVRPGPLNSDGLSQLAYDKNMYVLAASQAYQTAQETTERKHGLLTWALVQEGLVERAADRAPADGEITVDEWFGWAADRVPVLDGGKGGANGGNRGTELPKGPGQQPQVFFRKDLDLYPPLIAR